jgi:hypothetical protein
MLFGDPPVKRPFDLVQLAHFIGEKRLCPVLRHQQTHLVFGVDGPLFGTSLDQRRAGVVVRAQENRLAKRFREHHHEGQPEQVEEAPFVGLERFNEV